MNTLTSTFVEVLRTWPATDPSVADACRTLMIDGLAVAAAGAHEPGPALVAQLSRAMGAREISTVIGHGFSTFPALAARVNGLSMHVLDFEPMWNPPNHALSPILPAVLALAESLEHDGAPPQGAAALRALARGIEAQGRLRLASKQFEPKEITLHPPGLVGPIAAAAACASLLALNHEKWVAALGIAASRAGGLMANVGSMTKALHCGDAAFHGLEAALLARDGFTADRDALGGERGFGSAYFGTGFDETALTAPLKVPRIIDPGPSWKLFPSQYATHFAITAALDCAAQLNRADHIEAIRIVTPVMSYVDRPFPRNGLDGKFSFQYCVTVALLDGRVDIDSFADARRFAPDAERLLAVTRIEQDPAIPGRFDQMHVDVEVVLGGGRRISRHCSAPEGNWKRPVAPERIEQKARSLLRRALPPEAAEKFLQEAAVPVENIAIGQLLAPLRRTL